MNHSQVTEFFVNTVGINGNGGYLEVFDNYSKSKFFNTVSPKVFSYIESITNQKHEAHFGAALRKEKLEKVSTNDNVLIHNSYFGDFDTDIRNDKLYDRGIRESLEKEKRKPFTYQEIIEATERAKKRAKEILDKFVKQLPEILYPTYIIDSGHGFQVWWSLKEPETDLALWKTVQSTLVLFSGADNVKDHRRMMRTPGTMNYKYPKAPAPVTIIESHPDRKFITQHFIDFFDIMGFSLEDKPDEKKQGSNGPTIGLAILPSAESIEEVYKRLSSRIKTMLQDGERHPSPTDTNDTRSARDWSIFQDLVAARATDEQIISIFKDSICSKEKRAKAYNGDQYINRKIRQARVEVREIRYSQRTGIPKRKRNDKGDLIFDPVIEVKIFLFKRHIIFENEQLKKYWEGHYRTLPDRYYLNQITKQLKAFNSRQYKAREVLETLKNTLSDPDIDSKVNPDPYIFNLKNGLLDIRTMKLRPHTPDYLSTFRINANYNPNAQCPRFMRFLDEVFIDENQQPDQEVIIVIQEFIGYCLLGKIILHKAIILFGWGANGKSVLVYVIVKLFEGHISNVHFESIGRDLFATSDLAGSLVNISSEISVNAKLKDNTVKQIISGDSIRAQRKNQPAFDFRPVAKHIITANNLPRSTDKSFAFFRRFLVIPFNQTFLTEKEIQQQPEEIRSTYKIEEPNLEETLFKELDGIFLWALEGLRRLIKKKSFGYSSQIDALNKVFKIRSTTVESFLEDHVDRSAVTLDTEFSILFQEYVEYCKRFQLPPLSNRRFATELRNQGFIVEKGTDNITFVRGCSLKKDDKNDDEIPF